MFVYTCMNLWMCESYRTEVIRAVFQDKGWEDVKNNPHERRRSYLQLTHQLTAFRNKPTDLQLEPLHHRVLVFSVPPESLDLCRFWGRSTLVIQWKVWSVLEMVHHLPAWGRAFSCNTNDTCRQHAGTHFLHEDVKVSDGIEVPLSTDANVRVIQH
jgi:hypothetical protein